MNDIAICDAASSSSPSSCSIHTHKTKFYATATWRVKLDVIFDRGLCTLETEINAGAVNLQYILVAGMKELKVS